MNVITYTEVRLKLAGAIATALLITFAAVPAGAADAEQSGTGQRKPKPAHSLRPKPTKSHRNWRPWKR